MVAARRNAAVLAAAAITVAVGSWLALKAPYYGVPLPLVGLAVAVPTWLALSQRTGLALAVVLLYMGLLDGVIKLKSGGQAATLGRDIVLYAVAAGVAVRARGPFRLPPLGGWVVAWIVVIVVQLANPGNSSTAHAVASLRQHLEFLPLFFLGYVALRTSASLHAFFALLLAVATINGAVAAYQERLTPQQLAGWGPGYANLVTGPAARTFQGADRTTRVRPPALGSDMGFGGALGAAALPGGVVLLMTYRRRRYLLALIVLGMIGAAFAVLTSEARSAVIMAIVGILALLGLIAVGRQAKRSVIGVCLAAAMAAVAVAAIGSYDSTALDRYSSIAPGNATATIYGARASTWALTPQYMGEIPFGAGLGSVGPAAAKLGAAATLWNAESQFNFLVVEAGIPGLLVFLAFQGALCATIVTGLRRERDPEAVVLIAGLAAPLFGFAASCFFGTTTVEPPDAPYLWLAAGVISWWLIARQKSAESAAGR